MFHRCQSGTLYTNIQKSEIPQRVFFQKDLYSHQNRANLSNKQSCKSSVYGIGLHTCHLTHGKNFRHSCPQQIRLIHIRLPVTHGGSWFVYLLWGMARRTAAKSKTTPRSRSSNASSSGSSPRNTSPSTTPKCVVGRYSLDTLPHTWDNDPEVRAQVRKEFPLMLRVDEEGKGVIGHVDATPEALKLNYHALLPICVLMGENELKVPCIDRLIEALTRFYVIAKVSRDGDQHYQEAWAIRRCLQTLKHLLYRESPPQAWLFF